MKPTPITDAVLYANVGASLHWSHQQYEAAEANLRRAAAERNLSVPEYIEAVAPRKHREPWPARPL